MEITHLCHNHDEIHDILIISDSWWVPTHHHDTNNGMYSTYTIVLYVCIIMDIMGIQYNP